MLTCRLTEIYLVLVQEETRLVTVWNNGEGTNNSEDCSQASAQQCKTDIHAYRIERVKLCIQSKAKSTTIYVNDGRYASGR